MVNSSIFRCQKKGRFLIQEVQDKKEDSNLTFSDDGIKENKFNKRGRFIERIIQSNNSKSKYAANLDNDFVSFIAVNQSSNKINSKHEINKYICSETLFNLLQTDTKDKYLLNLRNLKLKDCFNDIKLKECSNTVRDKKEEQEEEHIVLIDTTCEIPFTREVSYCHSSFVSLEINNSISFSLLPSKTNNKISNGNYISRKENLINNNKENNFIQKTENLQL